MHVSSRCTCYFEFVLVSYQKLDFPTCCVYYLLLNFNMWHFFCLPTWHDGFLALVALGGIFIGVALGAQELFILGGEGLIHQRALALEAHETLLVPVAVLVRQILREHQTDS